MEVTGVQTCALPIFSQHQSQGTSIVPLYMELPDIVDIIQFPGTAGGNGPGITAYLCELDAGILGELLPQEVQPLSRYALHLHLSHSNPNIRLI